MATRMQRVEVRRKKLNDGGENKRGRNSKLERDILSLLKDNIDESGFIVYNGEGSRKNRTGSAVNKLIEWFLYKNSPTKPLDADIFAEFLKSLKFSPQSVPTS